MTKKLVFICTANIQRSVTAEHLFKNDPRFEVRSAGTSPFAKIKINRDLLEWADYLIVMEKHHRETIKKLFPDIAENKRILCLDIPDIYEYMDKELQYLIKEKMKSLFG